MQRPQTVIIGSGLSGLLISRALVAARIEHLLIGGPRDSSPRLGESLSLEASVYAFDFLEEFLPYFLSKHAVVGFIANRFFPASYGSTAHACSSGCLATDGLSQVVACELFNKP
jgi:hypothetical protein